MTFTADTFKRGIPVVPGTNIALLTRPSKMPGYSWSLPAGNVKSGKKKGTCPFAVFGRDALGNAAMCSGCYADPDSVKLHHKTGKPMRRGGSYGYAAVRAAQEARRDWTLTCLISKEGREEWVTTMVDAIRWATRTTASVRRARALAAVYGPGTICGPDYAMPPKTRGRSRRIPFFRVHDSGDMFSDKYAAMWADVVAALPDVRFWIPTRSYHGAAQLRILPVLRTINALPNAAVRPSALYMNTAPPDVDGLAAGTGAAADGYNCPSSHQGGACLDCRKCWGKTTPVLYRIH